MNRTILVLAAVFVLVAYVSLQSGAEGREHAEEKAEDRRKDPIH